MRKVTLVSTAVAVAVAMLTVQAQGEPTKQPERTVTAVKKIKQVRQKKRYHSTYNSPIAATIVATWNCQDKLPATRTKVTHSPWERHTFKFKSEQLNRWKLNLRGCRAELDWKKSQWNWQTFPSWVLSLARCESSYNWFATGSSSDGVFYSAFNISRSVYDRDAHYMGVRGWYEGPNVPSPYEQAMAVIGHVRLYGDGFTGRCAGIAQSIWTREHPNGVHKMPVLDRQL